MKRLGLSLLISVLILTSVNAGGTSNTVPLEDKDRDIFAYKTPNSDTLFILNTPLGRLTKEIWDNDTIITKKPTIIFVINLPNR